MTLRPDVPKDVLARLLDRKINVEQIVPRFRQLTSGWSDEQLNELSRLTTEWLERIGGEKAITLLAKKLRLVASSLYGEVRARVKEIRPDDSEFRRGLQIVTTHQMFDELYGTNVSEQLRTDQVINLATAKNVTVAPENLKPVLDRTERILEAYEAIDARGATNMLSLGMFAVDYALRTYESVPSDVDLWFRAAVLLNRINPLVNRPETQAANRISLAKLVDRFSEAALRLVGVLNKLYAESEVDYVERWLAIIEWSAFDDPSAPAFGAAILAFTNLTRGLSTAAARALLSWLSNEITLGTQLGGRMRPFLLARHAIRNSLREDTHHHPAELLMRAAFPDKGSPVPFQLFLQLITMATPDELLMLSVLVKMAIPHYFPAWLIQCDIVRTPTVSVEGNALAGLTGAEYENAVAAFSDLLRSTAVRSTTHVWHLDQVGFITYLPIAPVSCWDSFASSALDADGERKLLEPVRYNRTKLIDLARTLVRELRAEGYRGIVPGEFGKVGLAALWRFGMVELFRYWHRDPAQPAAITSVEYVRPSGLRLGDTLEESDGYWKLVATKKPLLFLVRLAALAQLHDRLIPRYRAASAAKAVHGAAAILAVTVDLPATLAANLPTPIQPRVRRSGSIAPHRRYDFGANDPRQERANGPYWREFDKNQVVSQRRLMTKKQFKRWQAYFDRTGFCPIPDRAVIKPGDGRPYGWTWHVQSKKAKFGLPKGVSTATGKTGATVPIIGSPAVDRLAKLLGLPN